MTWRGRGMAFQRDIRVRWFDSSSGLSIHWCRVETDIELSVVPIYIHTSTLIALTQVLTSLYHRHSLRLSVVLFATSLAVLVIRRAATCPSPETPPYLYSTTGLSDLPSHFLHHYARSTTAPCGTALVRLTVHDFGCEARFSSPCAPPLCYRGRRLRCSPYLPSQQDCSVAMRVIHWAV